jgi:hypothetical protein
VDWRGQLESATERQLAREAEQRKRASALGPPKAPASLAAAQPSSGWDGWDFAATHRYTTTSEGRPYININDHCTLTFPFFDSKMYRFGCNIGTLPPRTDLFQHMRDASAMP